MCEPRLPLCWPAMASARCRLHVLQCCAPARQQNTAYTHMRHCALTARGTCMSVAFTSCMHERARARWRDCIVRRVDTSVLRFESWRSKAAAAIAVSPAKCRAPHVACSICAGRMGRCRMAMQRCRASGQTWKTLSARMCAAQRLLKTFREHLHARAAAEVVDTGFARSAWLPRSCRHSWCGVRLMTTVSCMLPLPLPLLLRRRRRRRRVLHGRKSMSCTGMLAGTAVHLRSSTWQRPAALPQLRARHVVRLRRECTPADPLMMTSSMAPCTPPFCPASLSLFVCLRHLPRCLRAVQAVRGRQRVRLLWCV